MKINRCATTQLVFVVRHLKKLGVNVTCAFAFCTEVEFVVAAIGACNCNSQTQPLRPTATAPKKAKKHSHCMTLIPGQQWYKKEILVLTDQRQWQTSQLWLSLQLLYECWRNSTCLQTVSLTMPTQATTNGSRKSHKL